MNSVLKFFVGMAIVAIGGSMTVYTEFFMNTFGRIDWAEEHLGLEGGSRLMYKLLGIVAAFIGILVAFDLFGSFFAATAGQLLLPPDRRG